MTNQESEHLREVAEHAKTETPSIMWDYPTVLFNAADHIDAQAAKIKVLAESLEVSNVAIKDWLARYAGELCDETHVKDTDQRISDAGGTLSYISAVMASNHAALSAAKEPT